MATYIMFGKISVESAGEMSAERTKKANAIIEDCGGKVKAVYALLGKIDVVAIVDFPGTKEAMKAGVKLTKLLGISFATAPAVTMEEFDKLIEER